MIYLIQTNCIIAGGQGMYKGVKIAVVVPAYKEEILISPTLASVPDYVDHIYAVDDGSPDRTGDMIDESARSDPRITPIHHPENRGVGAAIISGYKQALTDGIDNPIKISYIIIT